VIIALAWYQRHFGDVEQWHEQHRQRSKQELNLPKSAVQCKFKKKRPNPENDCENWKRQWDCEDDQLEWPQRRARATLNG